MFPLQPTRYGSETWSDLVSNHPTSQSIRERLQHRDISHAEGDTLKYIINLQSQFFAKGISFSLSHI